VCWVNPNSQEEWKVRWLWLLKLSDRQGLGVGRTGLEAAFMDAGKKLAPVCWLPRQKWAKKQSAKDAAVHACTTLSARTS